MIQPLIQSLDKEFRNNIWSSKIILKVVGPGVKQKAEVVVLFYLKYANAANNTWNVERANIYCELLAACVRLGHKVADCQLPRRIFSYTGVARIGNHRKP